MKARQTKILTTMVKNRSPHSIVFIEDPEDDFLINVTTVVNRTGEVCAE